MRLLAPFDAAAPPDAAWGPMLLVALLVVAVVAMILGFGRITRRRRLDQPDDSGSGSAGDPGSSAPGLATRPQETSTDDELPTDPS